MGLSRSKIKNRIMLYVLSTIVIILLLLTCLATYFFYNKERENVESRNLLSAIKYSQEIHTFINQYLTIAKTFASNQENYTTSNRQEVMNMLKNIIENDNHILGFCVAYEPQKFDGLDNLYENNPGHDKSGKFIPYWNRLKGELIVEPLLDLETSDWYQTPKKTKKLLITNPIIYENVLMLSIDVPILKSGEFIGITALDLSLTTIENLLKNYEKNKLYPSSYAVLINSDKGKFISSSKPIFTNRIEILEKTLKTLSEENNNKSLELLEKEIKNKTNGVLKINDIVSGDKAVAFFSKINNTNFSFIIIVSQEDLLKNTKSITLILIFIGLFSIGIMAVILYFSINSIVKPLNYLTDIVENFSQQNFSVRSKIFLNDEVGKLSQTFNSMADDIVEYKEKMEEKVAERTKALNESLNKITKLKKEQDGDYFLTSLLFEPLSTISSDNTNILVDSLIHQKKKFQFKNKECEIGGDINISFNLFLNNKKYTIFVNGDAMGKSSQGAGGAVVFGTALNVIKKRYLSKPNLNIRPEKWLANSYRELHQVFLSFEGSMLLSCILGIIEEETGIMFFINAEHPKFILFRDRKASFIENTFTHYKLGSYILGKNKQKVMMHRIELKENDILIAGSDGKDDLVIDGKMNEDENLILSLVEKSNGNLNSIFGFLKETGEVRDDLSLLKVEILKIQKESPKPSNSFENGF